MKTGERTSVADTPAALDFERSIHGWKVLGALWLLVLLVVAVPSVGSSVINAAMVSALEMNRTLYGFGFGMFVMMMGLQGPVVVALMRKFGYRTTILIGGAAVLAGSIAMATIVSTGWEFALAFGILVGSGTCIAGMLPAQTVVTRWFTTRRVLAVSVVLSAMEIGGLIAPPALEKLLSASADNWRLGWWVIAALDIIAVIVVFYVIDEKQVEQRLADQWANNTRNGGRAPELAPAWSLGKAIRTRGYWSILSYMAIVGIGWIFLLSHGVVNLQGMGYSSTDAALAVAITVAASFIGNMTAGLLGDRVSPGVIASVSSLLMATGFVMFMAPHGFSGILLYAIPAGMGYGASQVCIMALIGNYFGKDAFASIFGSMMPITTFLGAGGAVLAGALYDGQGTYTTMCGITVVLCLFASFSVLFASSSAEGAKSGKAYRVKPVSSAKTII